MNYYLVNIHTRRVVGPFATDKELLEYLKENTVYQNVPQALKMLGVELTQTVNLADWNKQKEK